MESGRAQATRLQVGPASIGWAILGASSRAQQVMVAAIRAQPAAPSIHPVVGAWVAGVYSHHEQRAKAFAEQAHLPHYFLNLADLLERQNIHCIYVGSHPRHHYPLVMAALTAGKHVLCEAPLALTVAEAQTVQQAAAYRSLYLAVNYQRRADPVIQQARELLAAGAIGDVLGGRIIHARLLHPHQQTWRLKRGGGGVLLSQTIHAIDLLRYLLQDEVATIFAAQTPAVLGEAHERVEENVLATVHMQRTRLAIQLHASFFIPHYPSLVELYGSNAVLQVHHWAEDQTPSRLQLVRNGFAETIAVADEPPDERAVAHFHASLRSGAPLFANAEDGWRSLGVVLAAQQSLWSQRPEAPLV
ncbi:MAG: Gfo/Idh/MocA family oxidoreductase [Caldilineaceae bacterium]|nr:Gfo/Idh/MocA family oxidoreductase [Caldilineaceae bacterium]